MAISIITPQRQEAGFDKFLRRLGGVVDVANSGIGAYANVKGLQEKNRLTEAAKIKAEEDAQGIYGQKELDQLLLDQAKEGDQGAMKFKVKGPDGVQEVFRRREQKIKETGPLEKELAQAKLDQIKTDTLATKNKATKESSPESKEYKQNEFVAAGFATRADQAQKAFDDLITSGYDPSGFFESMSGSKMNPNYTTPENAKLYQQAKDDFVSAVLRKESGAAISPQERASEEAKYFPQSGDTDKVKAQKAASRAAALATLEAEAGGALSRVKGRLSENLSLKKLVADKKPNSSEIGARGLPEKPKTIKQNGVVYIYNEKTGEYE